MREAVSYLWIRNIAIIHIEFRRGETIPPSRGRRGFSRNTGSATGSNNYGFGGSRNTGSASGTNSKGFGGILKKFLEIP